MEKIAIISDIHGNITALNEVLKDIEKRGIKKIMCLGDMVIKCSSPRECLEKVFSKCEVVIKGNCEERVASCPRIEEHFWNQRKLTKEQLEKVEALPLSHDFYMSGYKIRIMHASPYSIKEKSYYWDFDEEYENRIDNMFKNTEYLNNIGEEKPDIVVFTGDLINKNAKINNEDIEFLEEELESISAKVGKYAIYGDEDYSIESYKTIMEKSKFKILNNSYDEIFYKNNESMFIIGLPSSLKEEIKLEDAFNFYKEDEKRKFIIVLVHDGKTIRFLDESTYEVDLVLGGHSLNGSIVIPYYGGIFIDDGAYKYYQEHYSKGITDIYISSGIGTNKYPYRIFNKPSFNLYRLKAQS